MAYVILLRRGLRADLPASAPEGEAFITTDTHELFVGTGTGMEPIGAGGAGGDATSLQGKAIDAQAPTDGEILIFDGATEKYVPGDPIVSGPDAPGAPPTRPPVQVGVFDGTNVRRLSGDSSGRPNVNVENFPETQPISAASLPLPTGAAKESGGNLDSIKNALTNPLPVSLPAGTVTTLTPPTPPTAAAIGAAVASGLANPLPVSAASLPLPTGAAKESGGNLDTIAGTVSGGKVKVTPDAITGTVTATLNAETSKVIGTTRNLGNAGAIFDAAIGAAIPANAVQAGNRGSTALPTAVADGQTVPPMTDKYGRQVVVANAVRDLVGSASVQTTDSSAHNLLASGGTGVYTDLVSLAITNESATATVVSLSDGTVVYKFALAANGGIVLQFPSTLPASSTATAWTVTSSAAVTLDFVVTFAKNK